MFSYLSPNSGAPDALGRVNPELNDQSLDYNDSKTLIIVPVTEREEPNVLDVETADNSNLSMVETSLPITNQKIDPQPWCPPIPPISSMDPNFGIFATDPSVMRMMPVGFNQFGFLSDPSMSNFMSPPPTMVLPPQKGIIHCKGCTLFPPTPNSPSPPTRERPPGCRTVFCGGLPENATEETVQEIFKNCGNIVTVRMSKKRFCHIRFETEDCVDRAIFLSGYRIRIGSNSDPPNTGRLHVDFAQARDDQYEWECQQRAVQREQRHKQKSRVPSPPPVAYYSIHEANLLMEKLKNEDGFSNVVQVLITWLERGDCNKRNASTFYTMIQSANSHIRRLTTEKEHCEEELNQMKKTVLQKMQGILVQFDQIEKVFASASKQKVWDHFTKAQRKNLELWRKIAEETRHNHQMELFNQRQEDEMELSDIEDNGETITFDSSPKRTKKDEPVIPLDPETLTKMSSQYAEMNLMKEENENLRLKVLSYETEVALLKTERQFNTEDKEQQIKALQMALKGMQQQLVSFKDQIKVNEEELEQLRQLKTVLESAKEQSVNDKVSSVSTSSSDPEKITKLLGGHYLTEKEAHLIGLISTFLHVHPFGASVDYICSYLRCLDTNVRSGDIEKLLDKFPTLFSQEFLGVGASLEKRWYYLGFKGKS